MDMLDALYNINSKLKKDNSLLEHLQLKRILRRFVRLLSNKFLPISMRNSRIKLHSDNSVPIIVSLTSFPLRINTVWMTIESLFRQQLQPNGIVLWLSRDQFPGELSDLPSILLQQIDRGLSIKFVDNDIRSYKKFYYAFQEYHSQLVLTVDDDLLFPSYFVKSIYQCHEKNPHSVIASFGFEYDWNETVDYLSILEKEIELNTPQKNSFFGSGGGTLFDTSIANYLDPLDVILDLCPTADDIYLNSLCKIAGYNTVFHMNNPLLSVTADNDKTLVSHNGAIGDPSSVNAGQLRNLIKHVNNIYKTNPFNNHEK